MPKINHIFLNKQNFTNTTGETYCKPQCKQWSFWRQIFDTLKVLDNLSSQRIVCLLALPFGVTTETLATQDPEREDEETDTPIFEKYDAMLHGQRKDRK